MVALRTKDMIDICQPVGDCIYMLCLPYARFSPNWPTGPIWSSSSDVHKWICPLECVFLFSKGAYVSEMCYQIPPSPWAAVATEATTTAATTMTTTAARTTTTARGWG